MASVVAAGQASVQDFAGDRGDVARRERDGVLKMWRSRSAVARLMASQFDATGSTTRDPQAGRGAVQAVRLRSSSHCRIRRTLVQSAHVRVLHPILIGAVPVTGRDCFRFCSALMNTL